MTSAEASTTTADAQTVVMVLKDEAGDYFLLPAEMQQRIRVPEEDVAAIEQLVAEQHDVQGYLAGAGLFFAASVAVAAAVVIGTTGPQVRVTSHVPDAPPEYVQVIQNHIGQMNRLRGMQ